MAELSDLADIELYTDEEGPHEEDEIDPRWAALLKLRSDDDSAKS